MWPHNLHLYVYACVPQLENVFSNVRQRYGLEPGDRMEHLDVNAIIWGVFMSVTLQAAVYLGKDYSDSLHSIKNQSKRTLKQLLNVTEKLIRDQEEISGIPVINWQQRMWQKTTLLTDCSLAY